MTDSKHKWCCGWMQLAFEQRYERTIFAFCEPDSNTLHCGPTFWLGMRSVRFEDVGRLTQERIGPTAGEPLPPITICTWRPIKFCPGCGRSLHRFYRNSFRMLTDDKLSNEHPWNGSPLEGTGLSATTPFA